MYVLLSNVHLLYAVLRKEAGPIDAAHETLQQAAVGRADHIDHVARLDAEVAQRGACVRLHAHDGGAGMADRAGGTVRVGANAGRVTDDVAGVADALVCTLKVIIVGRCVTRTIVRVGEVAGGKGIILHLMSMELANSGRTLVYIAIIDWF